MTVVSKLQIACVQPSNEDLVIKLQLHLFSPSHFHNPEKQQLTRSASRFVFRRLAEQQAALLVRGQLGLHL